MTGVDGENNPAIRGQRGRAIVRYFEDKVNGPGRTAPWCGERHHGSPAVFPVQVAVVDGQGKGPGLAVRIPVIGDRLEDGLGLSVASS